MRSAALCLAFCVCYVSQAQAWRLVPDEPFPPPHLVRDDPRLRAVFNELGDRFKGAAKADSSPWTTNITSFSISVTSASETLWTSSHTAPILGEYSDSPPSSVTDQTYFRIASISKVFTVLAALIEQKAKRWSLQDPITKWVPELLRNRSLETADWQAITLETLASQLSGIVRECEYRIPRTVVFLLIDKS
ncbi:MAG: hypothetical protein LQ338_005826 [Usnochroma carphineum]|nr:MAG: hypothetical protein LQ338_005826 [Usnochroma carphineum]